MCLIIIIDVLVPRTSQNNCKPKMYLTQENISWETSVWMHFFYFFENLKQHRKSGYFATGWFPEFAWVFHPNEQTKAFKRPRQTKKGRTKKWGKFSWHYPSGVRPPLSLLNDTFFHFQNRLNRAEYTKNTCFCGRKKPNGRRYPRLKGKCHEKRLLF